jgi:GntR family transcriptional regulator, transcriptional repressor for pyruvate dehydrogenase complex
MSSDIFKSIDHARTADAVVLQIERLILESVLRPGDRLPGERDLAQQLDVSRPILREALKELELRGLVHSRHGGGTFVADIVGQIFAPALVQLIGRHRRATEDYLEYRRAMEGMTAELAARRATAADRAQLSALVDTMREAHGRADFAEEAELDVELHDAVGEAAHNIVLLHTLRSCYRLLADGVFYNRALIYGVPGARDTLLDQHCAIAQAVIAGDPDRARKTAQDHIDFVSKTMEEAERVDDWEQIAAMRLKQRRAPKVAKAQAMIANKEAAE